MGRTKHPAQDRAAKGLPKHMPFLQSDLEKWEHPPVSEKAILDLLREWADCFTEHTYDQVDLTETALLWGYLCARPDARDIVGPGICDLALMRLGSINPSTKQLCIEFVASRFDGTAARFHPGIHDFIPATFGNLATWMVFDSRVFVKGRGKGSSSTNNTNNDIIVTIISRQDTITWLQNEFKEWENEWEPRRPFYTSLWNGERYMWWLYLNGTVWGRSLMPHVTDFCLCWLNDPLNRPGFHVLTDTGDQFIIDVLGRSRNYLRKIGPNEARKLLQ